MIVEDTIHKEQFRLGYTSSKRPFYLVYVGDKPTRAWFYIAELSLWLKYRGYPPAEYIRGLCRKENIQRRIIYGAQFGDQLPLSFLMPSTRLTVKHLKKLEDYYVGWQAKGYVALD